MVKFVEKQILCFRFARALDWQITFMFYVRVLFSAESVGEGGRVLRYNSHTERIKVAYGRGLNDPCNVFRSRAWIIHRGVQGGRSLSYVRVRWNRFRDFFESALNSKRFFQFFIQELWIVPDNFRFSVEIYSTLVFCISIISNFPAELFELKNNNSSALGGM